MPSEMFGTPIGARLAETDELGRLAGGIRAAQGLEELMQAPSILANREALTRMHTLQGDRLAAEIAEQQQLGELVRRTPSTGNLIKDFERLATDAMGAGLVTKGMKFADTAATLATKNAQVNASQARAAKAALEAQLQQVDRVNRLFGGVKDQAGMDYANALYTLQTGLPSPYAGVGYSPQLIKALSDSALSHKERLELAIKQEDLSSKKAERANRVEFRDFRRGILARGQELAEERERRLAKGGAGKGVSGPNKTEIDQAERMVREQFPTIESAGNVAYTIASEARELRQKNPALGAAQALNMAFQDAQRRGDFQGISGGVFGKDKTRFVNQGKTPQTAMMLRSGMKPADMVKDRYYVNPQGGLLKWTGKEFEVIKPSPGRVSVGRIGMTSADVDELRGTDDEEDEE